MVLKIGIVDGHCDPDSQGKKTSRKLFFFLWILNFYQAFRTSSRNDMEIIRAARNLLPKCMSISVCRPHVSRFEVFHEREFEEMLAISFLVLQACILFLSCFRKSSALLFLPYSHQTVVAHLSSTFLMDRVFRDVRGQS